jgi:hypothetical protein
MSFLFSFFGDLGSLKQLKYCQYRLQVEYSQNLDAGEPPARGVVTGGYLIWYMSDLEISISHAVT